MTYPDSPGIKAVGPSSEAAQKVTQHAATVRKRPAISSIGASGKVHVGPDRSTSRDQLSECQAARLQAASAGCDRAGLNRLLEDASDGSDDE